MSTQRATQKLKSKKKRLSPEDRREQLLACAMVCYADLGVMRAGHGDIAKRANVSTATVFNYFPTRHELTQAVFMEVYATVDRMFDTFPIRPKQHLGPVGILTAAYEFLVAEHPDVTKVMLNWSVTFSDDVRPSYLKFQSWALAGIQARIGSSKEDLSDARILLASGYDLARMKLDGTDQVTQDRFSGRVMSILSEGET